MSYKKDIDISIDTSELTTQLLKLKNVKSGAVKAVTRGLNVAVAKMKTASKEPIRKEYTIKRITDVTKSIKVKRASYLNMSADINSQGRPIALTSFKYKRNPSPGVPGTPTAFVQVKRSGGGGYTGGFVTGVRWKAKSGESGTHVGIFKRVGKERYPIKQLYGPSATEMLNNDEVKDVINETAVTEFDKEFNRQVNHLFKGGR